ncbi:MAG: hypothetical protein J7K85_01850 [Anaerolineaceae bacterium]|nr:hypothetical protein [Anaerolineaceae bacterium]
MAENRPAAYQGEGWQARRPSFREERQAGRFWSPAGVSSEFKALKQVVLFAPHPATPAVIDLNKAQHIGVIDFKRLNAEIQTLASVYSNLGITVHWIDPVRLEHAEREWFYNLFFVRDLFFMTPEGAIISRMGSLVRAGEEKHIAKTLSALGIPILRTITGKGTFEGADALWLRDDLVLIGVGNRTNQAGFNQVAACLAEQSVQVKQVRMPNVIQHLLGMLQIVDRNLAVIRREIFPKKLEEFLLGENIKLIRLQESEDVKRQQAMNFVTVAPRKIVMAAGNPETNGILQNGGIEVLAEVEVPELMKGAGGIACATGILERLIS